MSGGNPFAELTVSIPAGLIQFFVFLMIVLVIAGTLFDVWHKRSAQYFFENMKKSKSRARRQLGGGEVGSVVVKTVASEILTSSEFCNPNRRIAHLLTMYGFIVFVVATVAMIFGSAAGIWPMLWHLGALSLAVGGGWFFFAIRW